MPLLHPHQNDYRPKSNYTPKEGHSTPEPAAACIFRTFSEGSRSVVRHSVIHSRLAHISLNVCTWNACPSVKKAQMKIYIEVV